MLAEFVFPLLDGKSTIRFDMNSQSWKGYPNKAGDDIRCKQMSARLQLQEEGDEKQNGSVWVVRFSIFASPVVPRK
jgi:hypothetical protein